MNQILAMREKRASLWDAAKKYRDAHIANDGTMTAEDAAVYDRMVDDVDRMKKEIDRLERQESIEHEMNQPTSTPIKADGIYGSETHTTLMGAAAQKEVAEEPVDPAPVEPETEQPTVTQVIIVGGTVNIRTGNDTKYSRITSAKDGTAFEWIATAQNGWHAIVVNGQVGWVSGQYSKIA